MRPKPDTCVVAGFLWMLVIGIACGGGSASTPATSYCYTFSNRAAAFRNSNADSRMVVRSRQDIKRAKDRSDSHSDTDPSPAGTNGDAHTSDQARIRLASRGKRKVAMACNRGRVRWGNLSASPFHARKR